MLSIIVPVFNEEATVEQSISQLADMLFLSGIDVELVVVDGQSSDRTVNRLKSLVDKSSLSIKLVQSKKGRSIQMNTGAESSKGSMLLFLHLDSFLPDSFLQSIKEIEQQQPVWGFFKLKLSGKKTVFKLIQTFITWRSCLTSVATGDQALFVKQAQFESMGGYADIALMEDVELSKRLRRFAKPFIPSGYLVTSSRRWQKKGVMKTVLLMWQLRWLYWLGFNPQFLVKRYY